MTENAQFIAKNAAPAAADPAKAVQRRALGDVTNAAAQAKPIAKPVSSLFREGRLAAFPRAPNACAASAAPLPAC
jgi:hypothetical protein